MDRLLERLRPPVEGLVDRLDLPLPWMSALAVVVGLALLLLLWVVLVWRRVLRNRRLPAEKRNRAGRAALARARRLEKKGKTPEAAEAYEAAGLAEEAAELYGKAGRSARAADVYARAGRMREAAEACRAAGRWAQAGRLFANAGRWTEAAQMFDRAEESREAARAWAEAGEADRAGARYLQAGDWEQATRVLEEGRDREAYVRALVAWWEEELERQMGELEPTAYWMPALEAALEEAQTVGDWSAVYKIGGYLGRLKLAAEAAERLEQYADAKRLYESAGDLASVARVAEALGSTDEAAFARAEVAEDAGDWSEGARLFELAGETQRALELWRKAEAWTEAARVAEKLGRLSEAADAWLAAGDGARAAPLLERLERWGDAGGAYEVADQPQRAMECYRKADAWREAARIAAASGDNQAAIRDLQRHLRIHGADRFVSLELADLMMEEGMQGAAISLLEPVVPERPADDGDCDLLYRYGMLLEGDNRSQEAAKVYERILGYDLNFRDARERAERLRRVSGIAGAAGSGPVAGLDGGQTQQLTERYVIKEELGRGGMGIVVRAQDRVLDRTVALKIVKVPGLGQAALDNLLAEARATAKLNHPNIVQIYDASMAQGSLVMAMEYVEGQTIKDLIEEQGPLPVNALVLIFGQVAKALYYAHEQGLVHRDVKPANILWTADKQVKITDFGLARAAQELANTQTVVVGSPYYMAPEQLMGEPMDHRVDLYALGVSLFEATTGSLPFPKGDVGYHHVHTPAPDPEDWREDLPTDLARLVGDLMAKDRRARPLDAQEVLERLRASVQAG